LTKEPSDNDAFKTGEAKMTDFSRVVLNQSLHGAHERILQNQRRSFQDLLVYVWKHSTFYRDYYHSHGIRENNITDVSIEDLPFVSKEILMEHFDKVVTDARLHKRLTFPMLYVSERSCTLPAHTP
jgi:phenylacetate-coenzyme A ligase PaaK-like adenylate-forming protein